VGDNPKSSLEADQLGELSDSYNLIVGHSGDIASKGIGSPEGSTKLHIVPSRDDQPPFSVISERKLEKHGTYQ
jgi:hypothetical protein